MHLVEVKNFLYRHQAEVAKGLLLDEGIEAIVSADDCGGYRPHLTFGMGAVKLLVKESDLAKAQEVLKVLEEPSE